MKCRQVLARPYRDKIPLDDIAATSLYRKPEGGWAPCGIEVSGAYKKKTAPFSAIRCCCCPVLQHSFRARQAYTTWFGTLRERFLEFWTLRFGLLTVWYRQVFRHKTRGEGGGGGGGALLPGTYHQVLIR